jgi:hypothetical protein
LRDLFFKTVLSPVFKTWRAFKQLETSSKSAISRQFCTDNWLALASKPAGIRRNVTVDATSRPAGSGTPFGALHGGSRDNELLECSTVVGHREKLQQSLTLAIAH